MSNLTKRINKAKAAGLDYSDLMEKRKVRNTKRIGMLQEALGKLPVAELRKAGTLAITYKPEPVVEEPDPVPEKAPVRKSANKKDKVVPAPVEPAYQQGVDFEKDKAEGKRIDAEVDRLSAILKKFPKGPMGLTPDSVKATSEYRKAKGEFDRAFKAMQNFNRAFTKTWAKELKEERRKRNAELERKGQEFLDSQKAPKPAETRVPEAKQAEVRNTLSNIPTKNWWEHTFPGSDNLSAWATDLLSDEQKARFAKDYDFYSTPLVNYNSTRNAGYGEEAERQQRWSKGRAIKLRELADMLGVPYNEERSGSWVIVAREIFNYIKDPELKKSKQV